METDWRKVCKWLRGIGIFLIVLGISIFVYDTIYSLPDREGALVFIGLGLIPIAIAGLIRKE